MLKQILSKIKNKLILFCTALAALLLYLSPNLSADESVPLGEKNQLTVMTFNLRFANENDPYPWSIRKEAVREFLKERQPDIFGTQEGIYSQLQDIIGKESAYDWIGTGRDGGSNGEFMAIFYKKDRFSPIKFDHLWLSETPRLIGSRSWDTACTRMVTWVLFEDNQTHQRFYFVNTHLDHVSQKARVNGAKVICSVIKNFDKKLPVFLTGDFNVYADNTEVHSQFEKIGMTDTWEAPNQIRSESYNTFNDFKLPGKDGQRIDWIFTNNKVKVLSTEIVPPQEGKTWLSDHSPVISVVNLQN